MARGRSLNDYWMAEAVRLREAHWGPIEDSAEVRRARIQGNGYTQRILLRALFLGQREKLDLLIQKWTAGAKLVFAGMMIAAILAGAGTALTALGDGTRTVNLPLALVAMLGLHSIMFILWLLSFALKSDDGVTGLGRCWLWVTKKLARGPDAALVPQALLTILARNNALRWVLGGFSHSLWTGALLSLLLTLLAMLSTRRYEFNWETTLLSPDTFVYLTALTGWLPAHLGFAIPSDAMARTSDGLQKLPESVHALWSSWLIGCVVMYGLIPRMLALIFSLTMAVRNISALELDENLPAYANLRERLQPASEKTGIVPAPGPQPSPQERNARAQHSDFDHSLVTGLELPPDIPWPPESLDESVHDLGIIDTRSQRNALLERLQLEPPKKLLIACDSRQTPDRGTLALIDDLAALAHCTHIVLIQPPDSTATQQKSRSGLWQTQLAAAGFAAGQIHIQFAAARTWLLDKHADQ